MAEWFAVTSGGRGIVVLAHPLSARDLAKLGLPSTTPTTIGSAIEVTWLQATTLYYAGLIVHNPTDEQTENPTDPTGGGGAGGIVHPSYAGLTVRYGPAPLPDPATMPNTLYCILPAPPV